MFHFNGNMQVLLFLVDDYCVNSANKQKDRVASATGGGHVGRKGQGCFCCFNSDM